MEETKSFILIPKLPKIMINNWMKVLTGLVVIFLASCGSSPKNEINKWETNMTSMIEIKQNYPAFTKVLDNDLRTAKSKWQEPQKMDGNTQIEKMAEANEIFTSGYIANLGSTQYKIENILKKEEKINDLKLSQIQRDNANIAIEESNISIQKAKQILQKVVSTSDEASEVVKQANGELISAISALDKFIKANKPSKKKKKK